jgi:hypothetical protein
MMLVPGAVSGLVQDSRFDRPMAEGMDGMDMMDHCPICP